MTEGNLFPESQRDQILECRNTQSGLSRKIQEAANDDVEPIGHPPSFRREKSNLDSLFGLCLYGFDHSKLMPSNAM